VVYVIEIWRRGIEFNDGETHVEETNFDDWDYNPRIEKDSRKTNVVFMEDRKRDDLRGYVSQPRSN